MRKPHSIKHGLRAVLPPNRVYKSRKEQLIRDGIDRLTKEELVECQKNDKEE